MEYMFFTKLLKEKRIKNKLLQREMASLLGISISKYNKIENGSTEPSFKELLILIKLFKIDLLRFMDNIKIKELRDFD